MPAVGAEVGSARMESHELLKELLKKTSAKQVAAERKTTVRALMVDALERDLNRKPATFRLTDASVGSGPGSGKRVNAESINRAIDEQRESRFVP